MPYGKNKFPYGRQGKNTNLWWAVFCALLAYCLLTLLSYALGKECSKCCKNWRADVLHFFVQSPINDCHTCVNCSVLYMVFQCNNSYQYFFHHLVATLLVAIFFFFCRSQRQVWGEGTSHAKEVVRRVKPQSKGESSPLAFLLYHFQNILMHTHLPHPLHIRCFKH